MRTDDICVRNSAKSVGLSLRLLDEGGGSAPSTVLIEGPAEALRVLADLLIAVAETPDGHSFSITPFGAGSFHFSPTSELGIYIHRLDAGHSHGDGTQ